MNAARLRQRTAPTLFEWVKGHSNNLGNDGADALANQGAAKPDASDRVDTVIPPELTLPGVQLSCLTQSKITKLLKRTKRALPSYQAKLSRPDTTANIALARQAATDAKGNIPTARLIWKGSRNRVFNRNIRYFMWMIMHNGYKLGKYWRNIPNCSEREKCPTCGVNVEETMEHILTECPTTGQHEVWKLVSDIWRKRTGHALNITFGDILACGAIKKLRANGKTDAATTRLFRILISESAHLIWRLRLEHRIQRDGKDPATEAEVHNRWRRQISLRIELDRQLTNTTKWRKKAISKKLVLNTWRRAIENEDTLPADWTNPVGELQPTRRDRRAASADRPVPEDIRGSALLQEVADLTLIAQYEASARPEYHPDRVVRALRFLDEVLTALGLTGLDAARAGVCRFAHETPPLVIVRFTFPRRPITFPVRCRYTLLVSTTTIYYLVLFLNKLYADRGTINSRKSSIWALYCRSLLLTNFCGNVLERERQRMDESNPTSNNTPPAVEPFEFTSTIFSRVDHEAKETLSEALQEAWNEVQAIKAKLEVHICGLHAAVAYLWRENIADVERLIIANTQMIIARGLRSIQGFHIPHNRLGPLFNKRQVQEWIHYQSSVISDVSRSLSLSQSPPAHAMHYIANSNPGIGIADPRTSQLIHWPFALPTSGGMVEVLELELGKLILVVVEKMAALWPCKYIQTQTAELWTHLAEAAATATATASLSPSPMPLSMASLQPPQQIPMHQQHHYPQLSLPVVISRQT
ncbi:hypothetical protein C8F01DRAFT_1257787 [Mycena amicta]|nr:hypothetical protein C8F01DRAFT_1257787 [Mycena amicta]